MKLKDFLSEHATRDLHNEGAKMDIEDGNWLTVLGPDSDIGRQVAAERFRVNRAGNDNFESDLRRLFARVVIGWSFDEPIKVDLVDELFEAYPFIYDRVVTFYMDRGNFTKG